MELLQFYWILVAHVSSRKVLVDGRAQLNGHQGESVGYNPCRSGLDSLKAALECDQQ